MLMNMKASSTHQRKTLNHIKKGIFKMKKNNYSVYATNKGGKIASPKGAPKDEPRATKKCGEDLRSKRG